MLPIYSSFIPEGYLYYPHGSDHIIFDANQNEIGRIVHVRFGHKLGWIVRGESYTRLTDRTTAIVRLLKSAS